MNFVQNCLFITNFEINGHFETTNIKIINTKISNNISSLIIKIDKENLGTKKKLKKYSKEI